MCVIRHTEESLLELFSKGLLRGTVHTCIGQEACAVGVISALDKKKDILFSNHRGHGHYLTYSDDVHGLIAEIMGREEGVCGGVGGSQHIHKNNYYSNGIQGAGVPIVAGIALAEKMNNSDAISVAFIGDGTFGEGVIYETFNISALWKLPMLVVVEHNQYAQSTPSYDQHAGVLHERAKVFGYEVSVVDGMDLEEVYLTAKRVIDNVRKEKIPHMLFLNTYRFAPHSKGDDFRSKQEIDRNKKRDPLSLVRDKIGKEIFDNINEDALSRVNDVVAKLMGAKH